MPDTPSAQPSGLHRHFGLLQATALNVTQIVGAGIFATIPLMRKELPGPYLLLGWVLGAVLMLLDSLVWSELGAAMPGSGGSYVYLLESYGRSKFGRAMAFLFIWQFLISGPLELGSGLIAMSTFAGSVTPEVKTFNDEHSISVNYDLNEVVPEFLRESDPVTVGLSFGPTRIFALAMGALIIFLLYRRITALSKLTITFWLGVMGVMIWVLVDGAAHGDVSRAFAGASRELPDNFARKLSVIVALAMYSYLGYYNVCYIGDEVRDPGRTIPRAIIISALLVAALFIGLHLAMLSVVPWQEIPTEQKLLDDYSLPAEMMTRLHGDRWAPTLITVLLVWSCFGSAFAGMLGYARIPYGAAKQGHFYDVLARVHPRLRIPHVSLLLIGALTLFWSFFDLGSVINVMIVTRIVEQFLAQIVGVMLLRRTRPDMPRPYRIWLYPVPCLLAFIGWLALYVTSPPIYIALGLLTLAAGVMAFLLWSRLTWRWPFGREPAAGAPVS
jgi:amino acid transporter